MRNRETNEWGGQWSLFFDGEKSLLVLNFNFVQCFFFFLQKFSFLPLHWLLLETHFFYKLVHEIMTHSPLNETHHGQ